MIKANMTRALLVALLFALACRESPRGSPSQNATTSVDQNATANASQGGATQKGTKFRVETVVTGLEVPWSIVFTSATRMLITERPGRVRVFENGRLRSEPLATISDVEPTGESGLMGLTLHPQYAQNKLLYLAYAYKGDGGKQLVRVVRLRDDGNALADRKLIIEGIPAAQFHAGTRLRFGADGKLYVTTGDATDRSLAQRLDSINGKTLRLNDDGTIPPDNPFVNQPGARPEIWTYGHRNSQGLDFQPGTGLMFQTEHGPSGFDGPEGGDEVNIVERGKNYGWAVIHHTQTHEGMESPLLEYTPACAPASGSFYRGLSAQGFAEFRGNFFFGCLRGERIIRVVLDGRRVVSQENLLEHQYGRIRDVVEGPDGALYFSTSNRDGRGKPTKDDDRIMRLVPVNASPVPTPRAEATPMPDSPIRKVDFKNFTYPFPGTHYDTVRLKNGKQLPTKFNKYGIPLNVGYELSEVTYGDVTGDGIEEAFVVLDLIHSGTAQENYVYIYSPSKQHPSLLWSFMPGDRADGGLQKVYAEDGRLVVELLGRNKIIGTDLYAPDGHPGGGACCPDAFTRTRYEWRGGRFRQKGNAEVLLLSQATS